MHGQFHTLSRKIVLPLERQNRSKVSVEDDASHKSIVAIWKKTICLFTLKFSTVNISSSPKIYTCLILPDCSMDRASRDTEIFSSDVLTQSSMPLQPFKGKVKLELVVVGRLWMLSTEKDSRDIGYVSG